MANDKCYDYSELLKRYKVTVGDLKGSELNDFYKEFLVSARSILLAEDISADQLNSQLGQALTIRFARALMDNEDVATNPTITFLRSQLSVMTKGDRHNV